MYNAGLHVIDMDVAIAERAASLRHRYQEKVPWGDCIVAASGLNNKANIIISEDPHFDEINEIKTRKLINMYT